METVACAPWYFDDKVLLLGDAAHAVVPFYGQGMNAGFEDVTILDSLISRYEGGWRQIFKEFYEGRKEDTDALAQLSIDNCFEMTQRTRDPRFNLQREIENWFMGFKPDIWTDLHGMVSFTDRRYSDAKIIGDEQQRIMDEVLELIDPSDWKVEYTRTLIRERVASSTLLQNFITN